MRKLFKYFNHVLIVVLFCLMSFSSCNNSSPRLGSNYEHPTFKTKYTEEEHIERIRERVEEHYALRIERGDIRRIDVYILHAYYDHDPEYFLIEFDGYGVGGFYDGWNSHYNEYLEKGHLIGIIINDEYNIGLWPYPNKLINSNGTIESNPSDGALELIPRAGESPYKRLGLLDKKKYYGGSVYGFLNEEGKIQSVEKSYGNAFETYVRILSKKEQKDLMKASYYQPKRFVL